MFENYAISYVRTFSSESVQNEIERFFFFLGFIIYSDRDLEFEQFLFDIISLAANTNTQNE